MRLLTDNSSLSRYFDGETPRTEDDRFIWVSRFLSSLKRHLATCWSLRDSWKLYLSFIIFSKLSTLPLISFEYFFFNSSLLQNLCGNGGLLLGYFLSVIITFAGLPWIWLWLSNLLSSFIRLWTLFLIGYFYIMRTCIINVMDINSVIVRVSGCIGYITLSWYGSSWPRWVLPWFYHR